MAQQKAYPSNCLRTSTFEAAHSNPDQAIPLYLFWSDKHQSHYYTISDAEKDQIIDWSSSGQNGYDWQYSGVAFDVYQNLFEREI